MSPFFDAALLVSGGINLRPVSAQHSATGAGDQVANPLYLQHETSLNKGTLSSHLAKLEEAGYLEIAKSFRGKVTHTVLKLTPVGNDAFTRYRRKLRAAL